MLFACCVFYVFMLFVQFLLYIDFNRCILTVCTCCIMSKRWWRYRLSAYVTNETCKRRPLWLSNIMKSFYSPKCVRTKNNNKIKNTNTKSTTVQPYLLIYWNLPSRHKLFTTIAGRNKTHMNEVRTSFFGHTCGKDEQKIQKWDQACKYIMRYLQGNSRDTGEEKCPTKLYAKYFLCTCVGK